MAPRQKRLVCRIIATPKKISIGEAMQGYVFENAGGGYQFLYDEDLGLSLQLSLSPDVGHAVQKLILSGYGLAGECRFRCACPAKDSLKNSINELLTTAKNKIDSLIVEFKNQGQVVNVIETGLVEFAFLDNKKPRLLEYSCLIDEVLEGTICISSEFYELVYKAIHKNNPDSNYRLNEYFGQKQGVWLELEDLTQSPRPFFDIQNPIDLNNFRELLQESGHLEIPSRTYLTLLTALLHSFDKQKELFAEQADLFMSLQDHVFYAQLSHSLYDELAERLAEREREKSMGKGESAPPTSSGL